MPLGGFFALGFVQHTAGLAGKVKEFQALKCEKVASGRSKCTVMVDPSEVFVAQSQSTTTTAEGYVVGWLRGRRLCRVWG